MTYPYFGLVSSTLLDAMPRDILERQFTSMGLMYDAIVGGTVPGAKPAAGYGTALQAHLNNAKYALEAVEAAKIARDTDAEEDAIQGWMSAIVSANHVLYGACPPLLADIETFGVSVSLPTPKISLEAGVGSWKDYITLIKQRFNTQLNLYARYGLVCKEDVQKKPAPPVRPTAPPMHIIVQKGHVAPESYPTANSPIRRNPTLDPFLGLARHRLYSASAGSQLCQNQSKSIANEDLRCHESTPGASCWDLDEDEHTKLVQRITRHDGCHAGHQPPFSTGLLGNVTWGPVSAQDCTG
ncbi:hypothetical protein B0H19DRAFT_1240832 [Mycena capillaripes]|nr:hypothetical protein B0H19DRAFT_1240832 [Mycena capillaripes]